MERRELVLELAREAGFDLAGLAPLAPPPAASRFETWLERGHHGALAYLERFRDRIVDPRRILPEGRTLLVVGLAHARPALAAPDGPRIARYAGGRDYHNVLGKRLRKLGRRLAREGFGEWRKVVDAGPLLERSHASVAGLGFESKAANLLHPDFGPWFFLGELLLEEELAPTTAPVAGSCGTCRACLDACPTGAILEPGVVHAPSCISYQTIENPGPIPRELRAKTGPWVFGCDVCSEVCPFGRDAIDVSSRFGTHAVVEDALSTAGLVRWLRVAPEELEGSPLGRPGSDGLARNAAIVLGNHPSEEGREALLHALSFDPRALVREAAAWGLAHGHGTDSGVPAALQAAHDRERDPGRAAELRRSQEEARARRPES